MFFTNKIEKKLISLAEAYKDYFHVGTTISPWTLKYNKTERKLIEKHFNEIVAENCTKPMFIYKDENTIDFSTADKIIKFAQENNKKLRWHTFVWHNQMPKWIYYKDAECKELATKEMLEQRIKKYIQAVMEHTKGIVPSYDVVNEVISDKTFTLRTEEDHSLWQKIMGPDYVEKVFTWAHEANPEAELVINDYNIETIPAKREGMYNFVKNLLSKNISVSAIGLQMHISVENPPVSRIEETIQMFAELGLKVLVTEMDVSVYESEKEERKEYTPELLEKQAQRYKELFECFKRCAQKGWLTDVVLWGTQDHLSWKNNFPVKERTDIPLLFDKNGKAKPAFHKIVGLK